MGLPRDRMLGAVRLSLGKLTTTEEAEQAAEASLGELLGPLSPARTALEVGCGTGHFTRWLIDTGSSRPCREEMWRS